MNDDASLSSPESPPLDSAPTPAAVASATEAAAAPDSPVEAPPPTGPVVPATPYRTAPEVPWPQLAVRRSSLAGGVTFVFGVLLWAFVVMGELATSYAPGRHQMLVGEALAVVFVLGVSIVAWRAAMRRNLVAAPPGAPAIAYARGTLLAVGPLALWWLTITFASGLGKAAAKNVDGPITTLLLIIALAAALGGRRLAGLHGPAPSPKKRLIGRLLWTGASLITLVAVVEILGN